MREVKLKPPFDALQILIGIVVTGAVAAAALSVILFVVAETVEHFTSRPTADQLYGCTIAQQVPSGECK